VDACFFSGVVQCSVQYSTVSLSKSGTKTKKQNGNLFMRMKRNIIKIFRTTIE